MLKRLLIFLALTVMVSFLSVTYYLIFRQEKTLAPSSGPAFCIQEQCFQVEIADTPSARMRGLMYRPALDTDRGMLFIFPTEQIYPFWMKNTLIPLDIIWLNEQKQIVFMATNVQPCQQDPCSEITPDNPALYVLEVNAGEAEKLKWQIGDQARIIY